MAIDTDFEHDNIKFGFVTDNDRTYHKKLTAEKESYSDPQQSQQEYNQEVLCKELITEHIEYPTVKIIYNDVGGDYSEYKGVRISFQSPFGALPSVIVTPVVDTNYQFTWKVGFLLSRCFVETMQNTLVFY